MVTAQRPQSSEIDVIEQASETVEAAVRMMVKSAIRGATICGCGSCRAQAVATYDWATSLLRPGAGVPSERLRRSRYFSP